jgi:hypothetical protein
MERRGANTMIERRRATASFAAAEPVVPDAEQAIADAAEMQAAREAFAAWLRAGRDARGMTIAQVAQTTRIQQRALERLEAASFDELPADVFVRGFIRNYARCVGLSVDEALDRYGACGLTAGPVASVKAQALVSSMAPLAPDTARHHLAGDARGTTAPPRATTAPPRLLTSPGLPALLADADAAAATAAGLSPRGGLAAGTDTRMPAIRDDDAPAIAPAIVAPPAVATAPMVADGDDPSHGRSRRKGGQRKRRGQQRRDRARTVTASMAVPTIEAALVAAAFAEAPSAEAPIPAVEAAPEVIAAEAAAALPVAASMAMPVEVAPSTAMPVEVPVTSAPATLATSELATAIANLDPAASASLVAILEAALRVQSGQLGHLGHGFGALPSFDDDMPEIEIFYGAPTTDLGPVSAALASASAARRRSTTLAVPSLVIDDDDPESAEREREARTDREPTRRSFLPPILRDEPAARQGGLTLAVIILLIVATLTLSYLMRRPSSSGEGITSLPAAPTHVA